MRQWLVLIFILLPVYVFGASAGAPKKSILILGDSLSAAYHIANESGWPALLDQRLRAQHLDHPIINASISGETSAGGLARLPALLNRESPALVIVELGANDGLRGLPIEEIRANLTRIVQACRDAGAMVLLLGIELPINYGPQYRDTLRSMYRDVAAQFKQPLLPFLLDGVATDPHLMQDDGLHPTAAAEPRILDNVWVVLAPMLNASTPSAK